MLITITAYDGHMNMMVMKSCRNVFAPVSLQSGHTDKTTKMFGPNMIGISVFHLIYLLYLAVLIKKSLNQKLAVRETPALGKKAGAMYSHSYSTSLQCRGISLSDPRTRPVRRPTICQVWSKSHREFRQQTVPYALSSAIRLNIKYLWSDEYLVLRLNLSGQGVDLLDEHVTLLSRQPLDLVRLNPLGHKLEVGVVLFPQLLNESRVLLLHVFKCLTRDLHLGQQCLLLLLVAAHLHGKGVKAS